MNKRNIGVIIMGSQGSGKGTQAKLIAQEYDLQHLETGGILRNIAKEDSEIGNVVNDLINKKGEFVPWEIVKDVLNETVEDFDPERGIVFDGTPRRMEEVSYWEKKLQELGRRFDFIFFIRLPGEESIRRISSRRICEKGGHPLIMGKDVQSDEDKCPICGGDIYRREDDAPEKVLKRLTWSKEILGPVIEHYKEKGKLVEIDGTGSIQEVFEKIKKYINDRI
ncbi:MAG: nucleoside monophosphate kinase [Candidatus Pacebacteria bacterium]|nr:nucleoside monophosphate kinase [Candidatus Paceibacterota bacterium]